MQIIGKGDNAYSVSRMLLALNKQPGFSDVTMGQVTLSSPHEATLNARVSIKPMTVVDTSTPPAPGPSGTASVPTSNATATAAPANGAPSTSPRPA